MFATSKALRSRRVQGYEQLRLDRQIVTGYRPFENDCRDVRNGRRLRRKVSSSYRTQLAARFVAWREFVELGQNPSYAF